MGGFWGSRAGIGERGDFWASHSLVGKKVLRWELVVPYNIYRWIMLTFADWIIQESGIKVRICCICNTSRGMRTGFVCEMDFALWGYTRCFSCLSKTNTKGNGDGGLIGKARLWCWSDSNASKDAWAWWQASRSFVPSLSHQPPFLGLWHHPKTPRALSSK